MKLTDNPRQLLLRGFLIGLVVSAIALGIAFAVAPDDGAPDTGPKQSEPIEATHIGQTSHQVIYRFTDTQAGTVCYSTAAGGIDCLPLNQTRLGRGSP